jgi:hypothetical protein
MQQQQQQQQQVVVVAVSRLAAAAAAAVVGGVSCWRCRRRCGTLLAGWGCSLTIFCSTDAEQ